MNWLKKIFKKKPTLKNPNNIRRNDIRSVDSQRDYIIMTRFALAQQMFGNDYYMTGQISNPRFHTLSEAKLYSNLGHLQSLKEMFHDKLGKDTRIVVVKIKMTAVESADVWAQDLIEKEFLLEETEFEKEQEGI